MYPQLSTPNVQPPPEFYNVANIQSYSTPSVNLANSNSEISLSDIPPLSTHQQLVLNIIFPYENSGVAFQPDLSRQQLRTLESLFPEVPQTK